MDESAPHDTIVLVEGWVPPIDTPAEMVKLAPTFSIAGGGTNIAVDPDWASKRGVDKASANLGVTCNFGSTDEVV